MNYYFALQVKLMNRRVIELGIHPFLFYVLAVFVFLGLSISLFEKVAFAEYVYALFPLVFLTTIRTPAQNDFLKNISTRLNFHKIRTIENLLIALPFSLFLFVKGAYWTGWMLLFLAILLSYIDLQWRSRFVLPTPFYRRPFEFPAGFRKMYLMILVAYGLAVIGIGVGNFFLSLSGLAVLFFNCCSFYNKPEPPFFVWMFSMKPEQFIRRKIETAMFYTFLLCLPLTLTLCFFFVDGIYTVVLFQLYGWLLVIASVLGKYTQYPLEINLVHGIAIGISIIFPPLLLVIIPVFYFRAIKQLNNFLK